MPDLREIYASLTPAQRAELALPLPPPKAPGRKPRLQTAPACPPVAAGGIAGHWAQPKLLRAHDLQPRPRPAQAEILRVLRLGPDPMTVKAIALALDKDHVTVALTLRAMEKNSLVTRAGLARSGRNGKEATLWTA